MSNSVLKYLPLQIVARATSVALLLLLCGCDKCEWVASDNPFAQAECRIEKLMQTKNIASFQVAIARRGEIVYEKAFGMANVEKQISATPETMYLVASIGKPFVSTALMVMAELIQQQLN